MSKGGSTTSRVEYPREIMDPAVRNIQRGEDLARLGDMPYMGPDVAALTPRQQAAMQNTGGALSAFGMGTSGPVNAGMPEAQDFNGMSAYSSYPMYQQSVDAFREARPGQAAYRDGFFIDPVTGQMQTAPDQGLPVQSGPIQGGPVQPDPFEGLPVNYGRSTENPSTNDGATFQNVGGNGGNGYGSVFENYTGNDLIGTKNPNFGMYGDAYSSLTNPAYDPPGNVISRALGATSKDAKAGDGACVIATHAVSSGAFTPKTKRRAVVWCVKALHGKWWGEAIRRGYQALGKRKIEQGKAHQHYKEFRNYIDFATGENRTLIGGVKFAARTAQFFTIGIFVGGR